MGFGKVFLTIVTIAYNRTLRQYTLIPIDRIVEENDPRRLRREIDDWRAKKSHELNVVQVSSGISAAAVLAIFSWPDISTTVWIARGLWYWSLSLSVWSFLIVSQQNTMLDTIKIASSDATSSPNDLEQAKQMITRRSPTGHLGFSHYMILYFWQCPSMHMAYAWITFFAALTIHVCQPIVALVQEGKWTDDTRVMIFYIIAFGLGVINFGLCSKISRGPGVFQRLIRRTQRVEKAEGALHIIENGDQNLADLKHGSHRPELEEAT